MAFKVGDSVVVTTEGKDPDLETDINAWEKHLKKALKFPIQAEIVEMMERGPLQLVD